MELFSVAVGSVFCCFLLGINFDGFWLVQLIFITCTCFLVFNFFMLYSYEQQIFCHHRLRFAFTFCFVCCLCCHIFYAKYFTKEIEENENISLLLFWYLWNLWYALLEQISMCGNSLKWMETRKLLIFGLASI